MTNPLNGTPLTVALVDDQALFLMGIAMVIDSQDDMTVRWQANDGAEATERAKAEPVDVILMDVQMPKVDGIAATTAIIAEHPASKIIMLTTFDDEDYILGAISAGASGFLLKDTEPEDLLAAIRTVVGGDSVISPRATARIVRRLRHAPDQQLSLSPADRRILAELTPRETEILVAIGKGWSNQEICERLWISMPTTKTHVGRILTKTDARDRVHAALFAHRVGLVSRDDLLAP